MKYGIAVFPDKKVQEAADRLRIRHDPHYSLIPAHLTVREAEPWSDEKLAAAIAHLEAVSTALSPFTIAFNRVSSFFPVSHVLYMALEDPSPMVQLHQQVCTGPLALEAQRYVYTPHLTLAQQLTADELYDLYGNWRMNKVNLTSTIEKLTLLQQSDKGTWKQLRAFDLKKT
jgi:2'-5' RNA ligase